MLFYIVVLLFILFFMSGALARARFGGALTHSTARTRNARPCTAMRPQCLLSKATAQAARAPALPRTGIAVSIETEVCQTKPQVLLARAGYLMYYIK